MFARLLPVALVQKKTLKRNSTSPYKSIFDMNLHINKFKLRRNLSTTIELGIFIHLYGNWKVTFSTIANYAKDDAEITRREKT